VKPVFFRPAVAVFESVFRPFLRSRVRFRAFLPERPPDPSLPVVFVSNHVSWWDGFLLREVHRRVRPEAPFHTVMLERELSKHPYLRFLGCHGLVPGNANSWKAVQSDLSEIRTKDPSLCVAFYPQGRIWPAQRRPLGFQPGIRQLLRRLAPVQVVPVGLRFEPLNTQSPNVFAALGPAFRVEADGVPDLASLERLVEERLDALDAHLLALGEDAVAATALGGAP
jgi:1-acyl-sn-glycerol-3-phosphate acyltransferase